LPRIRPEGLSVCGSSDAWLTGETVLVERLSAQTYAYLDVGAERLVTVVLSRSSEVALGIILSIADRADAIHIFAENGGRLN
jgi:multiple sugar transport system ATP-binding protein